MAFVTCHQHKKSQDEQNTRLDDLEKGALSAEDVFVDKTKGNGAGTITVQKVKDAIAGDVAVAVKPNSGITGNGTAKNPLALSLGDGLTVGKDGKLALDGAKAASMTGESLAGDGIEFNENTNKLDVKTVRLVDASGTVVLGHLVDKGA
ncbi:hypothetical protein A1D22_05815 [Pasteurellaceae bacterium LFhippo2]|nr:hypothetical protein [Pasteurellaceae bacterium LFhippo2]